jgi:hypothetical protein
LVRNRPGNKALNLKERRSKMIEERKKGGTSPSKIETKTESNDFSEAVSNPSTAGVDLSKNNEAETPVRNLNVGDTPLKVPDVKEEKKAERPVSAPTIGGSKLSKLK